MNKRIKKKHRKNHALYAMAVSWIQVQWTTQTPEWKRCKKSGRKHRIKYYDYNECRPNRNHRIYLPEVFDEAIKKVSFDNVSHPVESYFDHPVPSFELRRLS